MLSNASSQPVRRLYSLDTSVYNAAAVTKVLQPSVAGSFLFGCFESTDSNGNSYFKSLAWSLKTGQLTSSPVRMQTPPAATVGDSSINSFSNGTFYNSVVWVGTTGYKVSKSVTQAAFGELMSIFARTFGSGASAPRPFMYQTGPAGYPESASCFCTNALGNVNGFPGNFAIYHDGDVYTLVNSNGSTGFTVAQNTPYFFPTKTGVYVLYNSSGSENAFVFIGYDLTIQNQILNSDVSTYVNSKFYGMCNDFAVFSYDNSSGFIIQNLNGEEITQAGLESVDEIFAVGAGQIIATSKSYDVPGPVTLTKYFFNGDQWQAGSTTTIELQYENQNLIYKGDGSILLVDATDFLSADATMAANFYLLLEPVPVYNQTKSGSRDAHLPFLNCEIEDFF